MKTESC